MTLNAEWTEPVELGATDDFTGALANQQILQNMLYFKDGVWDQWDSTNPSGTLQLDIVTGRVMFYAVMHLKQSIRVWFYYDTTVAHSYRILGLNNIIPVMLPAFGISPGLHTFGLFRTTSNDNPPAVPSTPDLTDVSHFAVWQF